MARAENLEKGYTNEVSAPDLEQPEGFAVYKHVAQTVTTPLSELSAEEVAAWNQAAHIKYSLDRIFLGDVSFYLKEIEQLGSKTEVTKKIATEAKENVLERVKTLEEGYKKSLSPEEKYKFLDNWLRDCNWFLNQIYYDLRKDFVA